MSSRERARVARRGAAMVETLIVSTMLIVCGGCIVGMYRLCVNAQRVHVEARATAWACALPGCGSDGAVVERILNGFFQRPYEDDVIAEQFDDEDVEVEGGSCTGSKAVSVSAGVLGPRTASASVAFACNEGPARPVLSMSSRIGYDVVIKRSLGSKK